MWMGVWRIVIRWGKTRMVTFLATNLLFTSVLHEESSKKKVNFYTLIMDNTDVADVLIPMSSVLKLHASFKNTLYGYFIGKKVAFLVVERCLLNSWKKYCITRVMGDKQGFIFIQFSSVAGLEGRRMDYARALVDIRAHRTLKDTMVVSVPDLIGNGVMMHTIKVEYEWKPSRCGTCLVFGPLGSKKGTVDNEKPMDDLVDDTRKKMEAPPKKTPRKIGVMELENSQNNALAKLPMLKLEEYEMWEIRIKQYFQIQDYALWEVIENGNSWVPIPVTATETGPSTGLKMTVPSTAEEKICKKNDVKARSLLLMALPNEHQLTFDQYVDAQSMFAAIKARFGGNEATKKTQKALLKQQYENFNASSSESLDSIFNRLQKLVSRLAILGVVTPPEDLNVKFLRSLPSEWDTHVVVWMNKPDFDTMGLDDLYNNFKIVEQKVKRSAGANNDDKNLAFLTTSSPSSTNTINIVNTGVSTGTTKVNTASTETSTASFSDATVYAFLSTQPQGSQLVHEDLEQLHDDDLEEMDLKWNMALLSMRARKFYQRTGRKIIIDGSSTAGYDKSKNQGSSSKAVRIEDAFEKAMYAIDGAGLDWSDMAEEKIQANMALMAFSDSEVTNDKSCSKSCLKNYEALKKQYDDLLVKLDDTGFKAFTYKRGHKEYQMGLLRTELEKITNKSKKGFGYNAVISPHPLILNRPTPLDLSYSGLEEFKEPEVNEYGPRNSSLKTTTVFDRESNNSKENTDDSLTQQPKTVNETSSVVSPLKEEKKADVPIATKKESVKPVNPSRRSVSNSQLNEKGFVDSRCSRHMSGNIAHLSDFKEFDGGYVTFGGGANGEESLGLSSQKPHNKDIPIELYKLGKFDGKSDEGFFVGSKVNTGSRDISTAAPEVNTATSEGLMGPIPTTEDTQVEDSKKLNWDISPSYEFISQEEPKRVSKALSDPAWVEAMQEELLQFKLQNVWVLVDLPKGHRAIGTKWVYKNKKDERGIVIRNKPRLCLPKVITTREGIDYDEVFAPVARIEAIRIFLVTPRKFPIMAASAIIISSDSSDESVGSPPSRVILFGDIPTVIPSTSVVAPETSTIAPVISSAAPMVETTLVASPTGLSISPFICTDSSEAPDSSDGPPSQDPYVATVARWRSRVTARPSSSHEFPIAPVTAPPGIRRRSATLIRPGEAIPFGRPYRTHLNGPRKLLTARKRVGPLPSRRLASRHAPPRSPDHHSSSSSSSSDSSPVHSLGLDASDQAHSGSSTRDVSPRLCYPPRRAPRRSEAFRRWCAAPLSTLYPPTTSESSSGDSSEGPMHSSPHSAGPSRKRCRSPVDSVPLFTLSEQIPSVSQIVRHANRSDATYLN
ncbi:putative ribonuclease H-like domain-containing protein [Tanacetum coccineum]|uniref:Ribonuclease H-like domain-containing protein n=1 Tax=Tanacetum coccineum TaxID=301880 RepID=A0ABQ5ILA0_9ASTR